MTGLVEKFADFGSDLLGYGFAVVSDPDTVTRLADFPAIRFKHLRSETRLWSLYQPSTHYSLSGKP